MRHVALGWIQCTGQTPAPPGVWVLAKGSIGYGSPQPRGAWENPSATWLLGGSNAWGRPKRYLALGSWQKAQLAMAAQPPRGASHCY